MHTAPTETYTLSLHDALPISCCTFVIRRLWNQVVVKQCSYVVKLFDIILLAEMCHLTLALLNAGDRKSTRLNSSHLVISYAVFCLKKKKNNKFIVIFINTSHM